MKNKRVIDIFSEGEGNQRRVGVVVEGGDKQVLYSHCNQVEASYWLKVLVTVYPDAGFSKFYKAVSNPEENYNTYQDRLPRARKDPSVIENQGELDNAYEKLEKVNNAIEIEAQVGPVMNRKVWELRDTLVESIRNYEENNGFCCVECGTAYVIGCGCDYGNK